MEKEPGNGKEMSHSETGGMGCYSSLWVWQDQPLWVETMSIPDPEAESSVWLENFLVLGSSRNIFIWFDSQSLSPGWFQYMVIQGHI